MPAMENLSEFIICQNFNERRRASRSHFSLIHLLSICSLFAASSCFLAAAVPNLPNLYLFNLSKIFIFPSSAGHCRWKALAVSPCFHEVHFYKSVPKLQTQVKK